MEKKPYQVDCDELCQEPYLEYDTISEALADNRIVSVKKMPDNRFRVREECDDFYTAFLTAEQLKAWGDELIALANVDEASEKRCEFCKEKPLTENEKEYISREK